MSSATISEPERQANHWAMILHLSMLAGLAIPYAGYVAPIVIWQVKKAEFPALDAHGKTAVNWMITSAAIAGAAFVAALTIIGIPVAWLTFGALAIASIALPLIAALKAQNGEQWTYPFALKILK